jgi:hypothetical protein
MKQIATQTINNRWMTVIDDLLSEEECTNFINKFDNDTLEHCDRSIAQYDRSVWKSPEFAQTIFNRISELLPDKLKGKIAVNDHFRFSKYVDGGFFDIHRDGINQDAQGRRAIMTINIFLNSEFQGGETDFLFEDKTLAVRAVPKAGKGAVFDREILHRGNRVSSGFKYLLRTDVMFDELA